MSGHLVPEPVRLTADELAALRQLLAVAPALLALVRPLAPVEAADVMRPPTDRATADTED